VMRPSPRAASLRASLLQELEATTQRENFRHIDRLRWLRDQLENYLDRWLAFAAVEIIPMKSLLADDLFTMVLVASETYDQQLAASPVPLPKQAWANFNSMLAGVRNAKDRSRLVGLRDALVAVGAELQEKSVDRT
jgi:hypothetical protein